GADARSRLGCQRGQRPWAAGGVGGRGRVAGEAFGLVLCCLGRPGPLVGVVAGDTSERSAALGVAPTPDPANALRADPVGVFAVVAGVVPVEDMAIVALLHGDRPGRSGGRVADRRGGDAGRDRREMMRPGTVAPLAPDGAVSRLRADPFAPRARESNVAIQAFDDLAAHADRSALEVLGVSRVVHVEDRPIPA